MNFTLDGIKELIEEALLEQPTHNPFLDARYNEQMGIIGHTNPYYRLFYLIAQKYQPALSVELGSWQGTAAAHLAGGYLGGDVVSIDCHKDDKAAQQRCIEATQYFPNLTYANAWTIHIPEFDYLGIPVFDTGALHQPIDLLYIDAWHDYQYAKQEWDKFSLFLADTALVICDDITADYNFEGMNSFWGEFGYEKFLDYRVHLGVPMGFFRYERQPMATDRSLDTNGQPAGERRMAAKPRRVSRKA